jgi:hypothetical protein
MEIDFAASRPGKNGIAFGQLVQWWSVAGSVEVSDEDIAAAKAIWEETGRCLLIRFMSLPSCSLCALLLGNRAKEESTASKI